jgi:acetate---CoA ligase (ADP-forming)
VGDLRAAAARAGARLNGLLVEPMASPGVELIVGGRRDPIVGPVVLVGLGGVLAEVLDDVAVLLAPVPADAVATRLERLRGAPLLHGTRGQAGVDVRALATLVARIGDLLAEDAALLEVDLNPVIAGHYGVVAVDALVVREIDTP